MDRPSLPCRTISSSNRFLYRGEVKGMVLTEFNEMETMEMFKEEGRQEGVLDTLISLVRDKIPSVTDAVKQAGMTPDESEKTAGLKP